MKRIALLFLLLITACSNANSVNVTPTLAVTVTLTATPKPSETPTPTLLPIPSDVQAAIGDESFAKLKDSIGVSGEIVVTDYATGRSFDAVIYAETIRASSTADWYFKEVVNADAKDNKLNVFKVVWNPDSGKWVRVIEINTNLLDYENYTHFNNIDKMVEAGDLDLVILSQENFSQPFPDSVQTAEYWIGVKRWGFIDPGVPGGVVQDTFFFMFPTRQEGNFNYPEIGNGSFNQGQEAFRYVGVIQGKTSQGQEIYLMPEIMQNTDKTNIINKLGFDPRFMDYVLIGPPSFNAQGESGMQYSVIENHHYLVPIIPTAHKEDWGNFFCNGGNHSITIRGPNYCDDVIVNMQTPGEVFNVLPDYMKLQFEEFLLRLKTTGNFGSDWIFKFTDGKIPEGLAMKLSRHISEAGFWYGSVGAKK